MRGASALGWPPQRFRAEGAAFVVRAMTVRHHREARYGEEVRGETWIRSFRRGLLCEREIRLQASGTPLADATQEWAHVAHTDGGLKAARASDTLVAEFPVEDVGEGVQLPVYAPVAGAPTHTLRFRAWHTWMDPLAHANHPAYVDWADEAVGVLLDRAGIDPILTRPVAERVRYRAGIRAPEEVTVTTELVGRTADGDVVTLHHVAGATTGPAATVELVRRLHGGDTERLVAALTREP